MYDNKSKELILIDFGLSQKYLTQYKNHIQFRNTQKIVGTPLFASNNALFGKELSWRDDIESLIYIIIFCMKGTLPW